MAQRNLQNVNLVYPQQFNVPDLLNSEYIFITKDGLIELESVLDARFVNLYRNRKVPDEASMERHRLKRLDPFEEDIIKPILEAEELEGYSDNLPLDLQSETLKNYIEDLKALQAEASERANASQE
jgi:hypothetical protein